MLYAQIELGEENVSGAVAAIERVIEAIPNTPFLYYELGLVHYSEKDYTRARPAFESALELDPQYANARYFYALSLVYGRDDRKEAVKALEIILETNPDNQYLEQVIGNIESGLDPLTGVAGADELESELTTDEGSNQEAVESLDSESNSLIVE